MFFSLIFVLALVYCGGSSGSSTTPPSNVSHRAFVTNTFSGALQIMDTQNDTTPFTPPDDEFRGTGRSGCAGDHQRGKLPDLGALVSSDLSKTLVYDPSDNFLYFITNTTEAVATDVQLAGPASMGLFSPDGNTVYVPVTNCSDQR